MIILNLIFNSISKNTWMGTVMQRHGASPMKARLQSLQKAVRGKPKKLLFVF